MEKMRKKIALATANGLAHSLENGHFDYVVAELRKNPLKVTLMLGALLEEAKFAYSPGFDLLMEKLDDLEPATEVA